MQITLHNKSLTYHQDKFMPMKHKYLGDYPVTISDDHILLNLCRFHIEGIFVMPRTAAEARHFFLLIKNPLIREDDMDSLFLNLIEKSLDKKQYQEFIQSVIKSSFKAGYSIGTEDKLQEIQRLLGLPQKDMEKPW